ncbi:hypothetical protein DFH08DRAFT_709808 [Mycena albidolilacea]|uniref:CxC5 like cysteine cluster associated with KDZ domain-containing protein n=1 Tax=Mycena albidolilacea TaxID=1033008 RepID=A0AAD6ZMJ2_9AGAR|nr:hypothetical protein DFH08DRAFT_709808 [Mycena albidolilacea]
MALFTALRRDPDLQGISFLQLMTFTRLLSPLKNDIILCQPITVSTTDPPAFLPPSIISFVSEATGVPSSAIPKCWALLKEEVWALPKPELSNDEELFRTYGWKVGISNCFLLAKASISLFPPMQECRNAYCARINAIKKSDCRQVVIYTLGSGVLPAWAVHLYCPDCNTSYRHNFSVQDGIRTYYGDTPTYIQIGEHQFSERRLVGLWVTSMLTAWVLAGSLLRLYNMALSQQQERDFAVGGWQFEL